MDVRELGALARLVRGQRWAALATTTPEGPSASMVAFVAEPDFTGFLLHLSRLAAHTRHLAADARASLVITEQDPGEGDPQLLARLTVTGRVRPIVRDTPEWEAAKARYTARFPESEVRFGFGDFQLLRLVPESSRFVGGFAQARSPRPDDLRAAARGTAGTGESAAAP